MSKLWVCNFCGRNENDPKCKEMLIFDKTEQRFVMNALCLS